MLSIATHWVHIQWRVQSQQNKVSPLWAAFPFDRGGAAHFLFVALNNEHLQKDFVMGGKGSGGSNRKPVERKMRIGNPSGRKLPAVTKSADIIGLPNNHIPEPHRPIGEGGRRLWNQVWQSGAGWLKQNMDTELILMLCEATEERTRLRIMLQADQTLWRERRALREVDRQIITLLGQIGFSPSERGLLGTGETQKHEFSDLNKRIAQKRSASR